MSVKEYIDLRLSEFKLKGTRGASQVLSLLLSMFLVIIVLAVVLNLFAYLMVRWLDGALGFPWGALIVIGFFLVVLGVLWYFRKKIFKNVFIRSIIEDPCINTENDLDVELGRVKSGIMQYEENTRQEVNAFMETRKAVGVGFKVAGIILKYLRSRAAAKKG